MAINWLRPPGTLTREDERVFPHLSSRVTYPGRCYLDCFVPLHFAFALLVILDMRLGGPGRPALRSLAIAGLVGACAPAMAILLACHVVGRGARGRLEAIGYRRFSEKMLAKNAWLYLDRKLIDRVPPFTEIEHTPYNDPNDPDALLRMLDDLAAQMERETP